MSHGAATATRSKSSRAGGAWFVAASRANAIARSADAPSLRRSCRDEVCDHAFDREPSCEGGTRDSSRRYNGFVSSTSLGSVTTSPVWNALSELGRYAAQAGSATLYEASYTRDSLGRITEVDETVEGVAVTKVITYSGSGHPNNSRGMGKRAP